MKGTPSTIRILLLALVVALGLASLACRSDSANHSVLTEPLATTASGIAPTSSDTMGVSQNRILFGQSAAFSGPAWELGNNMRLGILAAFQETNAQGGVHGRRLELVALDDAYEPEAAIDNTFTLIEDHEVFALIGAVGTPTSRSAVPVASRAGVPYIAPFTGAPFLRGISQSNVVNLRASYNQETEEMVARLIDDLGIERIAILYQDDSFGLAGLNGATDALHRRNMEPVAIGFYPRNTLAVKSALLNIQTADPEAVVIIGAYQQVATFIKWARKIGMDAIFITTSFAGSNALAGFLGREGENVFVTQVVPFPTDSSIPVVGEYLRALRSHDPQARPGWVSLEGYLAGRLVIESLRACGQDAGRECLLESIRNSDSLDLGGFELQYGFADNQGSDQVFLTVIGADGDYRAIDDMREVFP